MKDVYGRASVRPHDHGLCSFDFGLGEAALAGSALAASEAGIGLGAGAAGAGLAGAGAAGAGLAGAGAGTGMTLAQLASLASLAGTLGTSAAALMRSGGPGMPTPQAMDPTALPKALRPGVTANAAARVGGGLSPDFLASMIDQASGQPGGGMGILEQIREGIHSPSEGTPA